MDLKLECTRVLSASQLLKEGSAPNLPERIGVANALISRVGKSFDAAFKTLADDDPRGLLFLFAAVPLSEEVSIDALPREVTAPALQVDHLYRVKRANREWLWHIEVQTHYRGDVPQRILRYDLALLLKYPGMEIRSTLVLLVERSAPVPGEAEVDAGGVRVSSRYEIIRMWEIDPKPVLEAGRPGLLPWVGLMKATPEQALSALLRVEATGDPALQANSVLLGGLRYYGESIQQVLERMGKMFITEDILRESSVSREIIRKLEEKAVASGLDRGLAQGLDRGRVEEARRMVRAFLSARFPAIEDTARLDNITDVAQLESLLKALAAAGSLEDAAAILDRLSR